jgi:hypothetical protein
MGTNGLGNWLIIAILLAGVGIALFVLPRFMLKRAMYRVIHVFRYHRSLSKENAKTLEELGFGSPDIMERIMKPRDYKPYALQILIKQGVLCQTEDGRLYLSEEKLNEISRQNRLPL